MIHFKYADFYKSLFPTLSWHALISNITNFGEHHPNTAINRSNLASVYKALGETEKARLLFEQAYQTFTSLLGKDHPHTKVVKEWLNSL